MRIVLTGGGTGGHIYPAVAIGKQMQQDNPDTQLLYIGTNKGMESRIVPEQGIPFEAIEITGFRRKLSIDNVKTVLRFLKGVRRSKALLRKFKPDVVVGTGGYVCGPVVYAAAKLGIPTLIHEQNAIPGLTNQFLSRYASTIGVSFKQSEKLFPKAKKTLYTGNPCATNVLRAATGKGCASLGLPPRSRFVLIVGGSRGAKALNEAVIEMAPLLGQTTDVHFVFVTGDSYYASTSSRIEQVSPDMKNVKLIPYLNNMAEVLVDATLVVSRSGASSLAEMTALGLPSILIPSPNVTNNHQEANARSLVDAGAAEMILEKDLTGQSLLSRIQKLLNDDKLMKQMAEASKSFAMPDSAAIIASELKRLQTSK
ncbi:undecaprenyldiphospho-muramoylpentapeptide beta-N-acetylglucosaminyltransferase [Paenibacillus harenae]|uniref:UDP-N-acetylglucosamine--N-acetylmuramyl-(pentapeptide) pyrophosphoryl-undecaprenol N-acetylglucosamine transferase n=1 Tax=Paenibacillus harenae TaxID=306543 RepID=A0ABT9U2C6_PAEHA|nr:undecaprenyldiphospho-muramoylpentapeptide beta-N-acetylglucosaminyltransferase [Paenibacillus harenae]MDQ0112870.1 UDP-N-acetylglucosamine--N-acetylmuramyl-(pentapeptide) pyrophosphoryl-undecaprenol N-acetylglucosamine transferase [Paenibacillus harenae]